MFVRIFLILLLGISTVSAPIAFAMQQPDSDAPTSALHSCELTLYSLDPENTDSVQVFPRLSFTVREESIDRFDYQLRMVNYTANAERSEAKVYVGTVESRLLKEQPIDFPRQIQSEFVSGFVYVLFESGTTVCDAVFQLSTQGDRAVLRATEQGQYANDIEVEFIPVFPVEQSLELEDNREIEDKEILDQNNNQLFEQPLKNREEITLEQNAPPLPEDNTFATQQLEAAEGESQQEQDRLVRWIIFGAILLALVIWAAVAAIVHYKHNPHRLS